MKDLKPWVLVVLIAVGYFVGQFVSSLYNRHVGPRLHDALPDVF